ncbi:thioredoxin-like protein [Kickxella alabastrina]|uniref:thioredoxin-like protein n=1 Tax=Kickxella alabastrina TaxID=61397 RepID=UPI00221E9F6D|nr:thioredoxin-like protein [Kickxella alabastrina]KAI7820081.1 thioredoxin-like protein [Kickxella alabastrina]
MLLSFATTGAKTSWRPLGMLARSLRQRHYTSGRVFETTTAEFEKDVLKSEQPVVVDFYADWCKPCKMLAPILAAAVEESGKVKLAKINIDENLDLARDYSIASLPTVMAFHKGEPVSAFIGMQTPAVIKKFVEELEKEK